eukprot:UN00472
MKKVFTRLELIYCGHRFNATFAVEVDYNNNNNNDGDNTSSLWCAKVKCGKPYSWCNEKERKCQCPPNTYGDKCEYNDWETYFINHCKLQGGQIPDWNTKRCICPKDRPYWDGKQKKCIQEPQQQDDDGGCKANIKCENGGNFNIKTCMCDCLDGFDPITLCACQHRYTTFTFATKPYQFDDFGKDWEDVLIKYFKEYLYKVLSINNNNNNEFDITIHNIKYDIKTGQFIVEFKYLFCGKLLNNDNELLKQF